LKLGPKEIETLVALSQSRSEPAGRVQRASILLRYHAGETVSEIARSMATNRPRVERCVSKALELGVTQALADLPGRGRRPALTAEARAWVVSLACQKPKDLGYAQELWTTRLLSKHVRKHCQEAGFADRRAAPQKEVPNICPVRSAGAADLGQGAVFLGIPAHSLGWRATKARPS